VFNYRKRSISHELFDVVVEVVADIDRPADRRHTHVMGLAKAILLIIGRSNAAVCSSKAVIRASNSAMMAP
jgi:hypothetical protein